MADPQPWRRTLVSTAITLFWLVMVGALVTRQRGRQAAGPTQLADGESWMAIELASGERAGQLHVRRQTEPFQGVAGRRTSIEAELALVLLGRPADLALDGWAWSANDGSAARFSLELVSAGHQLGLSGDHDGRRLRATVTTGGERFPLELPLPDDLALGSAMASPLALPPLSPGETVTISSFDPATLGRGETVVRGLGEAAMTVAGEVVRTRKLSVATAGLEATVWVDSAGELVRAETPFGLVLRRVARTELDSPPTAAADSVELLDATAVRPSGVQPHRGARRLLLALSGTAQPPPASGLQRHLGGHRWEVVAAPPPQNSAARVPPALVRYQSPEPLLPADHPAIVARAAEIVGDEADPWRRALRLNAWVFATVEKKPLLSVPSALDVLRTPEGDCNEHTVLFVALARAVGLPARIAVGLVWSDLEGGFFYHAWPEVWVGDWVAMDPTLGQEIADATHLKLLEGGIERWAALVPYLGHLSIDVLEVG